jgi:hypothetical protein
MSFSVSFQLYFGSLCEAACGLSDTGHSQGSRSEIWENGARAVSYEYIQTSDQLQCPDEGVAWKMEEIVETRLDCQTHKKAVRCFEPFSPLFLGIKSTI